jgi:hypothetical protein
LNSGIATLYITNSISMTIAILPTLLNMCIYLDGFNVRTYNVPVYYGWLAAISFPRYVMELALNVAFGDQLYTCGSNPSSSLQCPLHGKEIIAVYGYSVDPGRLTADILGLIAAVVCLRIIAVVALYRSMRPNSEKGWICGRVQPRPRPLKKKEDEAKAADVKA